MNDTSPEVSELQLKMLLDLTGEARFLMGLSMNRTAREIVLSSLPDSLTGAEKRVALFLRYYGDDFDEQEREKIIESLRTAGMTSTA